MQYQKALELKKMNTYNPDNWVIVEISGAKAECHHRILAGWGGSYLYGSSWKISSGITKIVDHEHFWEIYNTSGSVYNCNKSAERLSGNTANILSSYCKDNNDEHAINQISVDLILEKYLTKNET